MFFGGKIFFAGKYFSRPRGHFYLGLWEDPVRAAAARLGRGRPGAAACWPPAGFGCFLAALAEPGRTGPDRTGLVGLVGSDASDRASDEGTILSVTKGPGPGPDRAGLAGRKN